MEEVALVAWATVMQALDHARSLGVISEQQVQLLRFALKLSCPCLCPRCLRSRAVAESEECDA